MPNLPPLLSFPVSAPSQQSHGAQGLLTQVPAKQVLLVTVTIKELIILACSFILFQIAWHIEK